MQRGIHTKISQIANNLFGNTFHFLFSRVTTTSHQSEPPSWNKETFLYKDLRIQLAAPWELQKKPKKTDQLIFGHTYSDHMMQVDWEEERGWARPMIMPTNELKLHPGAKVLHYAVELFEGMKAYRGVDNRIRLFRPEMNMARMRITAARCALPDFDPEELLQIICELIHVDKEWVPYSASSSLYIRPAMIATEPSLGVGCSQNAKLFVITGPVGAFFQTGFKPVSLYADPSYVRAFPGGVGQFKMGCNYAPTILIGKIAAKFECQQVLWLCGDDHKLTEVGSMNIFIYLRAKNGAHELVTPPLTDGLVLPGVTRDSLLAIAREWDEFQINERYPTMDELKETIAEGRLLQMFGAGTACGVLPVSRIVYKSDADGDRVEHLNIPTMTCEVNVMQRFYDYIVDIQYGRLDRPEWTRIVQ